MKLYELTEKYVELQEMIDSDDVDESIIDTLEAIEDAIEQKVVNIAKLVKNIEADIKAIKEEEKRLSGKRKSLENKVKSLKWYVENQLNMAGLDKVKTPTMTVYMQNNTPGVEIEDEKAIPDYYLITESRPNKELILEHLKDGIEIPGVSLKQTRSLRIR